MQITVLFWFPLTLVSLMDFADIKILVWNIHGAMNLWGRRHTRELVHKLKPSLFVLLETHAQFDSAKVFWSRLGYVLVAIEEASGHAGDIWVLSADRGVTINIVHSCSQIITLKLSKGQREWMSSFMYDSRVPTVRNQL